ncbi:MAG: HlyD family efflux transporter periplasmic adaptor subunit [Arcobacteraceae bacterium]
MKILYKIAIIVSLFSLSAYAKILDAKQLFNKTTVKVKEEKISQTQSFYGQISVDTSKVYDVVTRFDGYITKLLANEDFMSITKGQALFEIYSNDVYSVQKELRIVKDINANLYQSAVEKLVALGLQEKEVQRIKNSKTLLKDIALYAPFNSIVLSRNINEGSYVKQGELLLQLANIEQLWFIAQVYQKDLEHIKKNLKAKLYVDGFNAPFATKVDTIYSTVDELTNTVPVRFSVENKNLALSPNMFAKVSIQTQEKKALTLPKSAVIQKADKYFVFLYLSSQEYEPLEIEAKRIGANAYEIISGLTQGDEVIDNALFLLDSDAVTNSLYIKDEQW